MLTRIELLSPRKSRPQYESLERWEQEQESEQELEQESEQKQEQESEQEQEQESEQEQEQESEQELEQEQESEKFQLENSCDRSKDSTSYAVKLPLLANWLEQGEQADLIEMRQFWYGDRPLNLWTHFDVRIQTYKHLIYDHLWFWLRDKITSRFQPMERERWPRVKDSE